MNGVNSLEKRNKYGEPFSNGVGEIFIQQVMDRWDIKENSRSASIIL